KSATGAVFAASRSWKFSTPPPQVKQFHPTSGPHGRNPLLFVEFDQRIDRAAVLETIRLRSNAGQHSIRMATDEEIASDQYVSRLAAGAEKGRWLAFRVVDTTNSQTPLPTQANVNVTIGPGTPSLEGPRRTTSPQSFDFFTYGPFRVTHSRCGWSEQCSPFDQWQIQFTNPIDAEAFEQSFVRVEPEISSMKVAVYGNSMVITGIKRGRTTYRVRLDPRIRDQFGQTLGETAPLTFNVKSAPPALAATGGQFIVLDPVAQPRFSVFSINHDTLKLRLYSVGPQDWDQFVEYMQERDDRPRQPPGRLVVSKNITVENKPDEMVETRIDLAPALNANLGQVVIIVEPSVQPRNRWERRAIKAWVQVTGIGLDAFVDSYDLVGWATSLKDGRPLDGVEMSVGVAQPGSYKREVTGSTRGDGIARIALANRSASGPNLLVARKGNDLAILPEHTYWWNPGGGWYRKSPVDSARWYVFDDRKMYRPGEEVHIKGWIRRIGAGKEGDVEPLAGAATSVAYALKDSRGNEILKGNAPINAMGGFNTVVKLPPTLNLGYTNLEFNAHGGNANVTGLSYQHTIQVQEFRRPEFEVTAQTTEGPHFLGGSATSSVSAAYYAGGGLPNAEVTWHVTSTPGYFTPPNRSDFTFGKWVPWWIGPSGDNESRTETFTGRTDAIGKHHLKIDFVSIDPPRPTNVTAQASVMDVNRQAWTATTSMLVHPADLYVGIRSPRTFVQKGEPLVVQSIVTDLDGKAITGREVRIRAVLMDWVFERGQWQQKEANPQECVVKSGADAVECRFETKEGGVYRVTASIYDDRERRNESELTLWVAGGKVIPRRNVEKEDATLVPDRKDYQPGDTAEILVQTPFFPAEGVLTLRRSGILATERFRMDGPS
ncbi:MAG TPA: MG2 domain-containing protein, partial [Blastocatellia bacterium]|nr:MG2 domain-containing protein [Blastocatellia bacterium]